MNVQEVKKAILGLSREEIAELEAWLAIQEEREAGEWDAQIERDIHAGKLDDLAAQARGDIAAGRTFSL